MKKFIITETRQVEAIWTYEIEAETEADALEKIFTGEASPEDYEIRDNTDGSDSQFDIIEEDDYQAYKVV